MQENNDSICIFMEYATKGTIYQKIENEGALTEITISKYCRQILQGLAYLHEEKVVHRDLKCSNILLYVYDKCRLADFGLSKFSENIASMSGCDSYWGALKVFKKIIESMEKDLTFGHSVAQCGKCWQKVPLIKISHFIKHRTKLSLKVLTLVFRLAHQITVRNLLKDASKKNLKWGLVQRNFWTPTSYQFTFNDKAAT